MFANCQESGNRLEMKNVNKDILDWLEDIIDENNSRIEKKEWKSKYNSYVVYDYEPFCTDGFEINLVITSYNPAYLNFIKYLYDEKISTIEYLNNCIGGVKKQTQKESAFLYILNFILQVFLLDFLRNTLYRILLFPQ